MEWDSLRLRKFIGIVLKAGGTTGGTDLVARLLHKHFRVTVGDAHEVRGEGFKNYRDKEF